MNEPLRKKNELALPNWADCDFFCIRDYAATGDAPCGWRGQRHEVGYDEDGKKLICPRCGQATLFRIPSDLRTDS